ncbi:MAG: hypothetical protein OXD46_07460 [Chloroflexi bacterium]|nr:hypothetical protein [Chloroflexota bacterium]
MSVSQAGRDEAWDRLSSVGIADEGRRTDVATLLRFRDDADSFHPMYLFWDLDRPTLRDSEGNRSPVPRLSDQDERTVLEVLELLYQRHRVVYEPDTDDSDIGRFLEAHDDGAGPPDDLESPPILKSALVFIHIAAARAFKLKQTDGFSEEVRNCLNEVERTLDRLYRAGFDHKYASHRSGERRLEGVAIYHSTLAVSAISFVYLSRIHRLDGNHAKALHYLARASELYEYALPTPMGIWEAWPPGADRPKIDTVGSEYYRVGGDFIDFLTGLPISVSRFTELLELLKADVQSVDDWRAVADDCHTLADSSWSWRFEEFVEFSQRIECVDEFDEFEHFKKHGVWLSRELVELEKAWHEDLESYHEVYSIYDLLGAHIEQVRIPYGGRKRVNWGEFWHSAGAWATAQLSPGEYRKLRDDDEKNEAERRLKSYFFGGDWSLLPKQAQERLITADINWYSSQRTSREAILNDLLRATERMCYEYIWRPLASVEPFEWFSELDEFEEKRHEIRSRPYPRSQDPNIGDLLWVCEQPFLERFLNDRQLKCSEIQFLTQTLPRRGRLLKDYRNPAEHDLSSAARRGMANRCDEEAYHAYKSFLGIGEKGVLPEFARIGQKIGR